MNVIQSIFHNLFRSFHQVLGGNGALSSGEFRAALFLVIGAAFMACLLIILLGNNNARRR